MLTLASPFELRWTRLADLRPGDRVAVERRRELWPAQAPALDLFDADLVVERRALRYPTEMTPELARLLGYLVAEGSVEQERFRFSSADPEVMADYCRCRRGRLRRRSARPGPRPGQPDHGRPHAAARASAGRAPSSSSRSAACRPGAPRTRASRSPSAARRDRSCSSSSAAYAEGDAPPGRHPDRDRDRVLAPGRGDPAARPQPGRGRPPVDDQRLRAPGVPRRRRRAPRAPAPAVPRHAPQARGGGRRSPARRLAGNPNLDVIPGLVPALRSLLAGPQRLGARDRRRARCRPASASSTATGDNVSYARARAIPGLVDQVARLSPRWARRSSASSTTSTSGTRS